MCFMNNVKLIGLLILLYWMVEKAAKRMNERLETLWELKGTIYPLLLRLSYRQVVLEYMIHIYFILDVIRSAQLGT